MQKKYILALLIALLAPFVSPAQKNNAYVDGGMSLASLLPGASATYNYNVAKFLGLGAGLQAYDFHATMTNFQYVPGIFWDIRFNIRRQKDNQFFAFIDLGANLYKRNGDRWRQDSTVYYVLKDNGSYTGLGIAYFRRTKDIGQGHYFSLKLISNGYTARGFDITSSESKDKRWSDATLVVSFGFRF